MGMLRLSFPLWNSPLLSSTLSRHFVIIQFIDRLLILILFSQCCISSPSLPHAGLQAALIPRIWVVFLPCRYLGRVEGALSPALSGAGVTSWFILAAGKEIFLWLPRAVGSQRELRGQPFHRVKGFWMLPAPCCKHQHLLCTPIFHSPRGFKHKSREPPGSGPWI